MLDAILIEVSMAAFIAGPILIAIALLIRSEEECANADIPRWQRPSAFWLGIILIIVLSI